MFSVCYNFSVPNKSRKGHPYVFPCSICGAIPLAPPMRRERGIKICSEGSACVTEDANSDKEYALTHFGGL